VYEYKKKDLRMYGTALTINFIPVALLILVYPLPAANEPESDSLQIFESRDTIRVVADRFEVSLKELAYTYHLINRQEIQMLSQHSAMQLVDEMNPSAFVLEKNIMGFGVGPAGAGSINIRGQGGRPNTGMLVLIDGHPDFMGLFGHPLPDVYGVDDIAQVEILSGPASALFGSQAMGGVVNIRSGSDFGIPVKISVSAGSYSSYNAGINLNRQSGQHGFTLTARQRSTDGHIEKSSFKALNLQTAWIWTISTVWQLTVQGRYVPYEFDDPSRNEANDHLGIYGKIRRGMGGIILKNSHDHLQGSNQVFTNLGHHRFSDGFESHDFSWGASTYQQWKMSREFNLAGGGEFLRYGGKANVKDARFTEDSFGIYLFGLYNLSSWINLKGGLRYQYTSLNMSMITPLAGLGINILPNLQFYANYQSGFRYPTINELYLFPPSNPDLEEEKITSAEAGLNYYWQGNNYIRLAVFGNDASNLIQTVPPPVRYANSGAAKQWGLEAEVSYSIVRWMTGKLEVCQMEPDRLTALNPETQVKYRLDIHSGWFAAILSGKYVERLYAANDYLDPLPDYHVLNLMMQATYTNWSLNIQLQNLLDREYLAFTDYPAPGFYFMAGLSYSLF
jgi:outer membrane receptor protein involved in Fe transport